MNKQKQSGPKHIKLGSLAPKLSLTVTQKDIKNGIRHRADECAMAQAVLRVFPGAQYIRVDTKEVSFSLPAIRRRRRYFMSPAGARFAAMFDQGDKKIAPIRLDLNFGIEIPMGWRAKHPGSTRKGKVYQRTGKAGIRYTKHRSFGACNIPRHEAEAILSGATE